LVPYEPGNPASPVFVKTVRPFQVLPKRSRIRQKVLLILALKAEGKTPAEISAQLGLTIGTIRTYLYVAGKNGWLPRYDPKDVLEYELTHKIIKNLDEALDDDTRNTKTGMKVKTTTALKMAEQTMFKDAQAHTAPSTMMVLGVKVEVVGDTQTVREGTVRATPHFIEGQTTEEKA
jgi:hypothetical protein